MGKSSFRSGIAEFKIRHFDTYLPINRRSGKGTTIYKNLTFQFINLFTNIFIIKIVRVLLAKQNTKDKKKWLVQRVF